MLYEPSDDSELLVKQIKRLVKPKVTVLDMGCGSGILSVEAKKKGGIVLGVDINNEAVKHTRKLGVKTVLSDLFSKVDGKFDLIVFNPPYLPRDKNEDQESATITTGGKEGFEILIRFFKDVKKYLNPNGKIIIVISSLTQPKKVEEILNKNKFQFKIIDKKHVFFEDLIVYSISA